MDRSSIYDELGRVERDVVQGERRLAELERQIVDLKREGRDTTRADLELDTLRDNQRQRDQDRQRLLSMLQP